MVPQVVQYGAQDLRSRERRKAGTPLRIEPLDGVQKADDPYLVQVLLGLSRALEPPTEPADQRDVTIDQPFARAWIAPMPIGLEQLEGFRVRHADHCWSKDLAGC